jgi:hypothetical protein
VRVEANADDAVDLEQASLAALEARGQFGGLVEDWLASVETVEPAGQDRRPSNEQLISLARALYAQGSDDNIEVDDNAKISVFTDPDSGRIEHCWVQGWLYVPRDEWDAANEDS